MNLFLKHIHRLFWGLLFISTGWLESRAQTCKGSLGDPVVNVTFGAGTGFVQIPTAASGATTTYSYVANQCPSDGSYSVNSTLNANCFGGSWHNSIEDHTPGDVDGRMAIFNASITPGIFYTQTISGLCGNTTYEFAKNRQNNWRLGLN